MQVGHVTRVHWATTRCQGQRLLLHGLMTRHLLLLLLLLIMQWTPCLLMISVVGLWLQVREAQGRTRRTI